MKLAVRTLSNAVGLRWLLPAVLCFFLGILHRGYATNFDASPGNVVVVTGTLSTGTARVTFSAGTNLTNVAAGMRVRASGVPSGASVSTVGSNQITLSADSLLGSGTQNVTLTFVPAGSALKFSSGATHTLLIQNGSLFAWGGNDYGQLGDGTTTGRNAPVRIGSATNWVAVAAGAAHSLAVNSNGELYAWGYNDGGRLGRGNTVSQSEPALVGTGWGGLLSLSAGGAHSAAVKSNGSLWVWGRNTYGQVGNSSNTDVLSPTQVAVAHSFISVAAGDSHTLAVRDNGKLYAWGYNANGQLGNGTTSTSTTHVTVPTQIGADSDWASVAAGAAHSAALKTDNSLSMWGHNGYGQVGNGTTSDVLSPAQVASNVFALSCGVIHTVAITASGIRSWGYNGSGQLGDGSTTQRTGPVSASGVTGTPVSVTAGAAFSGAVVSSGAAYLWGNNAYGQLGDGTKGSRRTPVNSIAGSSWVRVSNASTHSLALDSTGLLYGWGTNGNGELGDSVTVARAGAVQIGVSTWKSVAAGDGFSLGVKTDGTLWAWGDNGNNQLGLTSTETQYAPVQVGALLTWESVSAGAGFGVGLLTTGELYSWGLNPSGQLGNGTTNNQTSAARANSSILFSKVVAGASHVLGIEKGTGNLYAWGSSANGQLGLDAYTSRAQPTLVSSGSWADIAAGVTHSLAVKSDGTVWAWGGNAFGSLGLGDKVDKAVPVQVTFSGESSPFTKVFADGNTSAALTSSGSLYTWGRNHSGQVGDGSLVNRISPYLIAGGTGWTSADVGSDALVGIKGGSLYTWGANGVGQLGYGVEDYQARAAVQGSAPAFGSLYTVQVGSSAAVSFSAGTFQFTAGESVRIIPDLSGTDPFTYSWRKDSESYLLATSEQLSFDSITALEAGTYTLTAFNNYGSASFTVRMAEYIAPALVTLPEAQKILTGGSVVLAVEATGSDLVYAWTRPGTATASGVNTGTLTVTGLQPTDSGSYTLTVSNSRNGVASSPLSASVLVSVLDPLPSASGLAGSLLANGTSAAVLNGTLTVNPGDNVSLGITVDPTTGNYGTLSYQWRKNTAIIEGQTSSALTLSSMQVADSGEYDVVVSNGASEVSVPVSVVVRAPIVIVKSPGNKTVLAGDTLTLSVMASGTDLSYQWFKDGGVLTGSGATTATFSKTATGGDSGVYDCLVSSPGYEALRSTAATVTVVALPVFDATTPIAASGTLTGGGSITLSPNLAGSSGAPTKYQWRRNGVNITGASASSYTTNVTGNYDLIVSNPAGTALSAKYTISSAAISPVITSQPQGATISSGTYTFELVASPVTGYQWRKNGEAIPGATASTLVANSAGDYDVIVSNGNLSVTSQVAKLLLNTSNDTPPVITQHPSSASVFSGASVALRVAATGSNLTFQWYKDSQPIAGPRGEASTLLLRSITTADAGSYYAEVSSGEARSVSNAAVVGVTANPITTLYGRTGQFGGRLDRYTKTGSSTVVRGGYVNVALTRQGAVSCRIQIGTAVYRVVGRLDGSGQVSLPFNHPDASPLVLSVDSSGEEPRFKAQFSGMLDSISLAKLGDRIDYTLTGVYTAAASINAQFDGYVLSSVTKNSGRVLFRGALSDGTRFTAVSVLHEDPDDPAADPVADLWVTVASNKTLLGKLSFNATEVTGEHAYETSTASSGVTRATVEGAAYVPPEPHGALMPLLSPEETFSIGLGAFDAAKVVYSGNRLVVFENTLRGKRNVLSFSASTGFFSGVATNSFGNPVAVSGVIIQGGFRDKSGLIGCGVTATGDPVLLEPIAPTAP